MRVVEALVGAMERHRDELTVFVAGYEDDIERFLSSDPGLRDRFSRVVRCHDYNEDALSKIMDIHLKEHSLTMSDDIKEQAIKSVMEYKEKVGAREFGNGRVIRNFVEQLPDYMANRVCNDRAMDNATPDELNAVHIEDVNSYVATLLDGVKNVKNEQKNSDGHRIGFRAKLKTPA